MSTNRQSIPIPNIRTTSVSTSGLSIAGRFTEVTINTVTWTALPLVPLANRNAICIQNISGENIKLNYDSGVAGFVGTKMAPDSERFYDITDSIVLYAKSETTDGVTIGIEELS